MDAHVTAQGSPIATVNPYTGERVRGFPALSAEEVGRAIDAAHRSFPNWLARSTADRGAVVQRAGRLMRERKEELAHLLTLEVGKLINSSRAEVDLASDILTYYGEHGLELLEERPLPVPEGTAVLVNEPLGVLLGVMPWNFPLYQVVRFAAPNLVLGNTILLKHASCPSAAPSAPATDANSATRASWNSRTASSCATWTPTPRSEKCWTVPRASRPRPRGELVFGSGTGWPSSGLVAFQGVSRSRPARSSTLGSPPGGSAGPRRSRGHCR
ncbi:aldehyde dehydrogenase family protein [Kitasatospora aureofaciens]